MIGLDTNVLVRYITQDHAGQADAATRIIEAAASAGDPLLVQPIVLCETVWVLRRAYRLPKREVLDVVENILRTAQFEIADKDILWQALGDYRRGKGDFADYVAARANRSAGAGETVTFDKALSASPHFRVLTP